MNSPLVGKPKGDLVMWKRVCVKDDRKLDMSPLCVCVFLCVRAHKGVEDSSKLYFSFFIFLTKKNEIRIQPQSSSLSPDGQDFLHGVKSHRGWLVWEAMTHSLQERAEFILDLQSANQSSATQSSWHDWRENIIIISQKSNPSTWKISLIIKIN